MLPILLAAASAAAAALFIGLMIRRRRKSIIVQNTMASFTETANAKPRQRADEPPHHPEAEMAGSGAESDRGNRANGIVSTVKRSVLIVDDQPMLRLTLKEVLESSGLNVSEAASGQEALDLARSSIFDLILLDIRMPGMDGIELLRTLRQWKGNPNADVPCALISALGDQDFIREAEALGVTKIIAKPFDIFTVRDYVLDELKVRRHLKAE